ncbi:protein SOSEKI 2-like [Tasmannia lanceolata]|uniref:protein SOSEKI 2-like n=1 Tax=Tasmannia lanceolata TaxID=3420 RepID=UPI004063DB1D
MDVRARRSRETSPDRARVCMQPKIKPFRRVQVVYYLCRNGQLEHPHFMEVPYLANQQLRLKDVVDRLTVLRGRGMPSLFSWSCKRSYKNGYVWNDLGENDVIYPTDGAEYVLKGSEIIEGCAEQFKHLQVSNKLQNPEPIFLPKRKLLHGNQNREVDQEIGVEEEEEEEEYEEKGSNSSSNTPYSRCNRGVSTDETEPNEKPKPQNNATELPLDDCSPPSSSSTVSVKTNNSDSQRFEENGEAELEPVVTRNSVLMQLIACGAVSNRARSARFVKPSQSLSGLGNDLVMSRKSNSLHKGVLCKTATKSVGEEEIIYMSENPRFGNMQSEEKEYFSGSIVESMSENRVSAEPSLKKSSSYNEERSSKAGIVEESEKREEEKCLKGKCIPRKKPTCSSKHPKK